ncbi:DUF6602 domain-containing protein [Paraliomyxa miuraensis]|uniref:DUF6602 domain-containing protein n=1 Tax=Paraliomyxa miuraensis TaxID=376150 RepID=UPI002259E3D9|nr:DUF6602 domain-containing protein [Paraliomyxa miuraensis]MCX4242507.1 hypothetical protein [Paraliomyxa miuraensis]
MTAFDLTDSIHGIHHRLVAQLDERRRLPHPSIKGDEGELLWLNVLEAHLPRRYAIRRGIVIDSRGARSDAIDLIIYDPQYTPVFLAQDEHAYVFAEAVYAVFEVKYELDAGNIAYAADKAASVRRLHRTNATIPHAGGEVREPKAPFTQIAGLLTLSHGWSSMEPKVREHVERCEGDRALDLVMCLQGGLLESRALPPDPSTNFETGPTSFVLFLYSLLHRLQRLATVPAVDWREYRARVRRLQAEVGGNSRQQATSE